jgi:hypothetical protein
MIIYLNIDVVLLGSCSHVIMMMPKVDPHTEQGARMWNRDRLKNRMSLIKNSNDNTISILKWSHFRCPVCKSILLNKNHHCFHSVNGITLALSQSDHIKRRTIKLRSGRIDCAQEKSCSCTLTDSHSQKISSLQMCFCRWKCSFKFALLVENFAIDSYLCKILADSNNINELTPFWSFNVL